MKRCKPVRLFVAARYFASVQAHQRKAISWGLYLQVFCQAGPPQRVDCSTWSQWKISVKCLSQERNDVMPARESVLSGLKCKVVLKTY